MKIFAAQPLGTIGKNDTKSLGPLANINSGVDALTRITKVISAIIGIMTVAATIWFMFQLFVGGISWISSGGEKAKLEEARNRITNAFVGLIIVIAGWMILAMTGKFLGIDILIESPPDLIQKMGV